MGRVDKGNESSSFDVAAQPSLRDGALQFGDAAVQRRFGSGRPGGRILGVVIGFGAAGASTDQTSVLPGVVLNRVRQREQNRAVFPISALSEPMWAKCITSGR
jgi:hypothetical protein